MDRFYRWTLWCHCSLRGKSFGDQGIRGKTPWLSFLAQDSATVSNTSVCLSVEANSDQVKEIIKLLETEGVAFDIGAYRDAPPGLRVWCGATIEREDVVSLIDWLEWAYVSIVSKG